MGHTQSTVTVVDIGSLSDPAPGTGPKKIGFSHDPALGGLHFDMKLFDHFAATCASQHGCTVRGKLQGMLLWMRVYLCVFVRQRARTTFNTFDCFIVKPVITSTIAC